MGLDVRVAAHPEDLRDRLLAWLDDGAEDPLAPHVVVVPNVGVRSWLAAGIAARTGIAAGVEFLFPADLRQRLAGLPGPADDPWRPERLAWHVLAVTSADDGPPVPWRGRPARPWSLARRVADLLDAYGTQRPDLIAAWAAGRDGGWQADVWRAVRRRVGVPAPAELVRAALEPAAESAAAAAPEPSDGSALPARIAVFGVSALSVPAAALLVAAARDRDVTVLVPVVAPALLDRVRAAGPIVDVASGVAPARTAVTLVPDHPLLAAWGRPAVDAAAVLVGLDAAAVAPTSDVAPDGTPDATPDVTQLARLRRDLAADRPGRPVPRRVRADGRGGDGSLQVHACHGLLRQFEVLRDALLHAFADDPTLRPEDVLVVCGDLRRAAPLVGPVLGAEVAGHRIPVAVADRSAAAPPPVPAAFDAVLAVAAGRAERDEVLALVALPPVAAALDLSEEDLELLTRAADELDVRWGVDAAHRARWGYPADVATGTWREAIDRLLVGMLVHPDDDATLAGLAPAVDVRSQDAAALGRLATAVGALGGLAAAAADPRPLSGWAPLLRDAVARWLVPARPGGPAADAQALAAAEVRAAVDALVADAAAAGADVPLDLLEVRAAVADRLGRAGGGGTAPAGAVRVASTVPLRGVPARVVAVLDVDRFAAAAPAPADDLLAADPRVGERDPRAEPAAALLDAVAAAGDRLLLLCDGQDVGTGAELPLPTAVEELLDAVPDVDGDAPLVVRHPRHLADPRSLGVDPALARLTGGRPWTHVPAALRTVAAGRGPAPAPLRARWRSTDDGAPPAAGAPGATGARGVPVPVLGPADLRAALTRPARAWLRHGLRVVLPADPGLPQRDLPVWVGRGEQGLERWQLLADVVQRLQAGVDPARWREARAVAGGIPPGRLGTALLDEVVAEAAVLVDAADVAGPEVRVPVAVDVAGVRIEGVLRHRDGRIVDVSASSTHPSAVVGPWVDLLVARAAAAAGSTAAAAIDGATVVRRDGDDPAVRTLVVADDAAPTALATVVDLALRARGGPLALLPRTAWTLLDPGAGHAAVATDVARDLRAPEARLVHGDLDVAAVVALPSGPAEAGLPGADDDPAVARVARVLTDAVAASARTAVGSAA